MACLVLKILNFKRLTVDGWLHYISGLVKIAYDVIYVSTSEVVVGNILLHKEKTVRIILTSNYSCLRMVLKFVLFNSFFILPQKKNLKPSFLSSALSVIEHKHSN